MVTSSNSKLRTSIPMNTSSTVTTADVADIDISADKLMLLLSESFEGIINKYNVLNVKSIEGRVMKFLEGALQKAATLKALDKSTETNLKGVWNVSAASTYLTVTRTTTNRRIKDHNLTPAVLILCVEEHSETVEVKHKAIVNSSKYKMTGNSTKYKSTKETKS